MRALIKIFFLIFSTVVLYSGCGKCNALDEPSKPGEKPQPEEKTYSVGDYYAKGFVKGIVVSTDDKGEHGMLVSLKEYDAAWSYRHDNVMDGQPSDGKYNTSLVQSIDGWKEYYPAFEKATSANVGSLKDWFLPSASEIASLYAAYTGEAPNESTGEELDSYNKETSVGASRKEWFNKCLTDNGGVAISVAIYWTSCEVGPSIAYAFDMASGKVLDVPSNMDKGKVYKVRAMASF